MKGRLTIKNGKYYVIISYQDESGSNKNKWIATGLDEKNNKRAANEALRETVANFKADSLNKKTMGTSDKKESPLFADYINEWLKMAKPNLELSTYATYERHVKTISDYFRTKKIRLADLKPADIQGYYNWMMDNGKTVQECEHHHVNIRRALQIAYRADLILTNPADKIERPKSPKHQAKFYTIKQIKDLFEAINGDKFELIYKMTTVYGLRRSELLGLKWNAINFDEDSLTIKHAVVQSKVNGKVTLIKKDRMKNKSSTRTLPLLPFIKEELLKEKERQEKNKKLYYSNYSKTDMEYVFVDDLGTLIKPSTVTFRFKLLLSQNGLPIIRYHELRHTCASLLLACGISMKEIQEWLGHSTFSTTADIYSHLNYTSKLKVADTLAGIFGGKPIETKSQNMPSVIETMQIIFRSAEVSEVKPDINATDKVNKYEIIEGEELEFLDEEDGELEENETIQEIPSVNEIEEYKHIKKEMERLGFDSVEEYYDYLQFLQIKQKKKDDFEM